MIINHVLAAAITGQCNIIVTNNLGDFPQGVLDPHDIKTQQPDDFLHDLLQQSSDPFCAAVRRVRARLKNPPYSVEEYLDTLNKQGFSKTTAQLKSLSDRL